MKEIPKIYTGVGARNTPLSVQNCMTEIAFLLGNTGWTLRSGAAGGADSAFESGATQSTGDQEIYLPWPGFAGHKSPLNQISDEALELASELHPAWEKCSAGARKLHARNAYQVLGTGLDAPSSVLVCWTPGGKITGGTGTAIRLVMRYDIPVLNLGKREAPREAARVVDLIEEHHKNKVRAD